VNLTAMARAINDPVCPLSALFPLGDPDAADMTPEPGITIAYINPTTARADDLTIYEEL